jgi:hypothetical protein
MSQFRCYCADQRCLQQIPTPDRPDDLVFPISLSKSVGQGGENLLDDTRTVQRALNRVKPEQGGPTPLLGIDGIFGPKTRAAICRFQSQQVGFADARLDPGGPTLAKLNQLLGKRSEAGLSQISSITPSRGRVANAPGSFSVTDENMKTVYLEFVPAAHSCVVAAVTLLQTPSSDRARSLLNKYFRLDQNTAAMHDLALIKQTFEKIQRLLARNAVLAEKTFIPMPGVFTLAQLARTGVLAMTQPNGAALKGKTSKVRMMDGSVFFVEDDKIWIQVTYFFCTDDLKIGTLVHELAHYVGAPEGRPDMIDDPPGRSSNRAAIDQLTPAQRPRIAEVYALFAFEARFLREPLNMLLDLNAM